MCNGGGRRSEVTLAAVRSTLPIGERSAFGGVECHPRSSNESSSTSHRPLIPLNRPLTRVRHTAPRPSLRHRGAACSRFVVVPSWQRPACSRASARSEPPACAARARWRSPPCSRAVLPADTFADGPRTGTRITPAENNGRTAPFDRHPVQGVSGVLNDGDGTFLVLSDNGYGNKANSPDYNLRVYRVRPCWRTASGGPGTVEVLDFFELRDPDNRVPFPIVNAATPGRILTGADFDLESFRRLDDGTFWFGDEFGPFLLHADATGRLTEPPIPLPIPSGPEFAFAGAGEVRSPDNPAFVDLPDAMARTAASNLASSRGFEGMALSIDGTRLYPMLEGAIKGDPDPRRLVVSEFEIAARRYTCRVFSYRMEFADHAIGELTAINADQFLVIERDNNEGERARFKRVYLVDAAQLDRGYARKTEVVDLMRIADPGGITAPEPGAIGLGDPFSFPFTTIESVLMLDPSTMLIVHDNNYPFSNGRRPGSPDDTEFIQIRLPVALNVAG
jgi:hypothetical protein